MHCAPLFTGRRLHHILGIIAAICCVPIIMGAPTRTFDLVSFTPPTGWNVEEKASGTGKHLVLSRTKGASYCMIVLYASTPASGDLTASFAAEWKSVALRTIDAVPMPQPAIQNIGETRLAIGGTSSKAQGNPVMALMFVLDAGSRVVSMLVLSPSAPAFDAFKPDFEGLLTSLQVKHVGPTSPGTTTAVIVQPTVSGAARRPVTADLTGEWGRNDGFNTTYVDRATGVYAGTDSLHFTEKWIIAKDATILLDFYAIRNGRRILEKITGTVSLSEAGIFVVKKNHEEKYVLRGWLETPTMTVMTLNGPWYEEIPADILANPQQGANLDKKWIRQRKQ